LFFFAEIYKDSTSNGKIFKQITLEIDQMNKNIKYVTLSVAIILLGTLMAAITLSNQVYAQESKIDLKKLKQILNETRAALEANDDPGALTQLDLADQLLSGNMTAGTNASNTEAIVTG